MSGGGASSGLGGGGGYYDKEGYATFRVNWQDAQGKRHVHIVNAKDQDEANKKAVDWRKKNKEVKKMARPEILTKKEAKKYGA